jgi:hypothetical protein
MEAPHIIRNPDELGDRFIACATRSGLVGFLPKLSFSASATRST